MAASPYQRRVAYIWVCRGFDGCHGHGAQWDAGHLDAAVSRIAARSAGLSQCGGAAPCDANRQSHPGGACAVARWSVPLIAVGAKVARLNRSPYVGPLCWPQIGAHRGAAMTEAPPSVPIVPAAALAGQQRGNTRLA